MIVFILTFFAGGLAGWIVGSGNTDSVRRWIYAAVTAGAAAAVAAWEYIQHVLN